MSTATKARPQRTARRTRQHALWRDHSLGLCLLGIFLALLVALVLTGHRSYNSDQLEHGEQTVSLVAYLGTGHFWEALFENWESEFLQMGAYIFLTVFLIQKGSSESKDPEKDEAVDDDPRQADLRHDVPWPVRRGGMWLRLYENSLLIAFTLLFVIAIIGHALGGLAEHNAELETHHQATMTLWNYVSGAQFWFESFQNWQSEFVAVLAIVMLTVWLRQKGSPESKPVAASHRHTGSS